MDRLLAASTYLETHIVQSCCGPVVVLGSSFGSNQSSYLFASTGTTWNFYDPMNWNTNAVNRLTPVALLRLVDGTNLVYGITSGKLFAWNMSKVVNNNWPTGITWETPLPTPLAIARGVGLFGVSADLSTVVVNTYNEYWGYTHKEWYFTMAPYLGLSSRI